MVRLLSFYFSSHFQSCTDNGRSTQESGSNGSALTGLWSRDYTAQCQPVERPHTGLSHTICLGINYTLRRRHSPWKCCTSFTYDTALSFSASFSHNNGKLWRISTARLQIRLASRLCAFAFWLLFLGVAVPQSAADLLASHHELPSRAGVQLRVRALPPCVRPGAERGEEEVSEPLHLVARPAQPDEERSGAGGLQLRPRLNMREHQAGHRALPAQDYQHRLHGSPAPVRERPAVQLRHA